MIFQKNVSKIKIGTCPFGTVFNCNSAYIFMRKSIFQCIMNLAHFMENFSTPLPGKCYNKHGTAFSFFSFWKQKSVLICVIKHVCFYDLILFRPILKWSKFPTKTITIWIWILQCLSSLCPVRVYPNATNRWRKHKASSYWENRW